MEVITRQCTPDGVRPWGTGFDSPKNFASEWKPCEAARGEAPQSPRPQQHRREKPRKCLDSRSVTATGQSFPTGNLRLRPNRDQEAATGHRKICREQIFCSLRTPRTAAWRFPAGWKSRCSRQRAGALSGSRNPRRKTAVRGAKRAPVMGSTTSAPQKGH